MRALRLTTTVLFAALAPVMLGAQGFAPESLVNTKVIPHNTPVMNVIGMMRDITAALGVNCAFCHVEQPNPNGGRPRLDFPNDSKRNKLVARQMMLMVQEINRRVDTLPERPQPLLAVTCMTCHRGVSRPEPLTNILTETATSFNVDSAVTQYRALRQQYYGRASYDFGESTIPIAAGRLARAGKVDEGLKLLALNEEYFPTSSGTASTRGSLLLMKHDTTGAIAALREAIKRDPRNGEARQQLQQLGQQP